MHISLGQTGRIYHITQRAIAVNAFQNKRPFFRARTDKTMEKNVTMHNALRSMSMRNNAKKCDNALRSMGVRIFSRPGFFFLRVVVEVFVAALTQ